MIKQLKKITIQMVAGANLATLLLMFLVGFSDRIQPVDYPMLSNVGLGFPVLLAANLGFLIFWLIFKTRMALIPILGFIICYVPVRKYSPLNIQHDIPDDALKVLSYNVWLFDGWEDPDGDHSKNPILRYIADQKADIVCLQEASTGEVPMEVIDSVLNKVYAHHDTIHALRGGDILSVYSKYPILSHERIHYESKGNVSAGFYLNIKGRKVLVINNHLETTSLSPEDKEQFKQLVKGDLETDTAEKASKLLVVKLGEATKKRAPEADAVAEYIEKHKNMPIILCGDFNDSPISYARRTVAKSLTDCYVATGNGPGISYHRNGFYVRIDHIMCSDHFEPYRCYIDKQISNSDHYPIICWLKMNVKP